MHKVTIIILTILSVIFPISGANAIESGTLVEYCRPFANRGFEPKVDEDALCVAVISSIENSYSANCTWLKAAKMNGETISTNLVRFIASGDAPINALTQAFLNWAEANPGKWEITPSSYAFQWLSAEWPCDY